MSGEEIIEEEDDFEKLLNSFINSKVDDYDDDESPQDSNNSDEGPNLSAEAQAENDEISQALEEDMKDAFEQELAETFEEARNVVEENEQCPELKSEESELAQAFINYQHSIDKICVDKQVAAVDWLFQLEYLYPNYKPSVGRILATDLVIGWNRLSEIFPDTIGAFQVNSSDEEFLNFAETVKDQDLQLAIISYVEILIDMESCELSYQAKLLKYQEKHIKRLLYEEYLARKERQQRFIEAVKKKDFPIDAERLISNYFRVAQKDMDGAYQALTTNPAIFAPIDFGKIKPRFFGLVKVTPKDGIRVNIQIGKFMKKVKV